MIREHLRAVVWPRKPAKEKGKPTNYRYAIVGMLVTDKPIEGLEGENEILLDGASFGLTDALVSMEKKVNAGQPFGDATGVLLSLGDQFTPGRKGRIQVGEDWVDIVVSEDRAYAVKPVSCPECDASLRNSLTYDDGKVSCWCGLDWDVVQS